MIQIRFLTLHRSHATNASRGASLLREAPSRGASSRSRRGLLFSGLGLALLALAAGACSGPPSPRGWAPARPTVVEGQGMVLIPHKAKVFAFKDGDISAAWRFPAPDRDLYPVSDEAENEVNAIITTSSSLDDDAKEQLTDLVAQLTIAGPSGDALKSALDASALSDDEKDRAKSLVDDARRRESDAQKKLKAIYGDIAVSEDGATAYVATFRGILFALDVSTGNTRWLRDLSDQAVGGVAISGDRLYIGTKGDHLYAYDVESGERLAQFKARGEIWSTPLIVDDTLYLTSLDGTAYALSLDLSETRWTFDGAGSGIAGSVAVVDGTMYVGAFDNRLYAVDAATGEAKWSVEGDNWFWAPPAVEDGVVYAASLDGKVYAVNADDGTPAWDQPYDTGSIVRSAPVLAGGGLVVASRDARLHKLDLDTGRAVDGTPLSLSDARTVEADLAVDDRERIYVIPRERIYFVFEADDGLRSLGGVPLPN